MTNPLEGNTSRFGDSINVGGTLEEFNVVARKPSAHIDRSLLYSWEEIRFQNNPPSNVDLGSKPEEVTRIPRRARFNYPAIIGGIVGGGLNWFTEAVVLDHAISQTNAELLLATTMVGATIGFIASLRSRR